MLSLRFMRMHVLWSGQYVMDFVVNINVYTSIADVAGTLITGLQHICINLQCHLDCDYIEGNSLSTEKVLLL